MKLITRDTDYAVRALGYMAGQEGRMVSATELVEELKMPRPFLRKLLQALNRKSFLVSYKGKGGGFKLAKEPAEILLIDLVELFQGKFSLNECIFKKQLCPNRGSCVLRSKIGEIEANVLTGLGDISLKDLL